MADKPDIIRQMEEKLGFPLKDLDIPEILPVSKNWAEVRRGYALNQAGQVTGLRLEYCSISDIIELIKSSHPVTHLNLQFSWWDESSIGNFLNNKTFPMIFSPALWGCKRKLTLAYRDCAL